MLSVDSTPRGRPRWSRTFGRAWRASCAGRTRSARSPSPRWSSSASTCRAAWGRPIGAVAIPVLVTLMVLVVATALLALVVLAERPTVRLRDALRASLYLAVRRWYLTAVSLAVLAAARALIAPTGLGSAGRGAAALRGVGQQPLSLRPALDPCHGTCDRR